MSQLEFSHLVSDQMPSSLGSKQNQIHVRSACSPTPLLQHSTLDLFLTFFDYCSADYTAAPYQIVGFCLVSHVHFSFQYFAQVIFWFGMSFSYFLLSFLSLLHTLSLCALSDPQLYVMTDLTREDMIALFVTCIPLQLYLFPLLLSLFRYGVFSLKSL